MSEKIEHLNLAQTANAATQLASRQIGLTPRPARPREQALLDVVARLSGEN